MKEVRQFCKLFNYRPIVLIFLSLIFGILFTTFIQTQTLLVIIISIVVLCINIFYCIIHQTFKYIIIMLLCFIIGAGIYSLYLNKVQYKQEDVTNKFIIGSVFKISNRESYLELFLEDVKINGEDRDYNIRVKYYNIYNSGYEAISLGDFIGFTPTSYIDSINYFGEEGIPYTYYTDNNIGADLVCEEIEILSQKDNLRFSILKRVRENLSLGLNNFNGELIYSAMFGDRTHLGQDLYIAYQHSGVVHLLSVSGLHVALIVAILYWILNKFKVQGWLKVAIVAVFLFIYAYLCSFSYSVLRAVIMSLVLIIAPIFFKEYDILNSICFAGCIILFINPSTVYNVSALLSFGCVFGIAMLTPIFKAWFKHLSIPEFIKDGFCISLSTFISTFIVMEYYFDGVSPISLISNIIILPIFSVLFTIAFVITIISLILPFVSYLLVLINPLFEFTNWLIIFISNISIEIPMISVNYLTIILSFILLTLMSKYNLQKGFNKFALVNLGICVMTVQMACINP